MSWRTVIVQGRCKLDHCMGYMGSAGKRNKTCIPGRVVYMLLFAKTIVAHNYQVLDIETSERKRLDGEFRVLIDEDMCEII